MIKTKTITEEREVCETFICDKCKKSWDYDDMEGQFQIQEALSLNFTGGYASVFGDMNNVKVDICQNCLFDMIDDFCRYNEDDEEWDDGLDDLEFDNEY